MPSSTEKNYVKRAIEHAGEGKKTIVHSDSKGIAAAASYTVSKAGAEIHVLGGFGRGGGKEVISAIAKEGKGKVTLTPTSIKAITFYERMGFVEKPGSKFFQLHLTPEVSKQKGYIK